MPSNNNESTGSDTPASDAPLDTHPLPPANAGVEFADTGPGSLPYADPTIMTKGADNTGIEER